MTFRKFQIYTSAFLVLVLVSLFSGLVNWPSDACHGFHWGYGVFWLAATKYNCALFHEEVQDPDKEAVEAEEHAEVSSNIGNQSISIIDEIMLLHLIVS